MAPELFLALVAAVTVLILIPGPNVALIVANSLAHGIRYGLVTVAGVSSAMVVQLGITVLGMTAVLSLLAEWFEWLRWLGVAYLVYLGLRTWRAAPTALLETETEPKPRSRAFLSGFLVSLTNPETLLFWGAFLPQFIAPDRELGAQLAILFATVLVLALLIDSLWATLAARLRGVLDTRGTLRNRLTGGLLIAAGLGLAMARTI